jgi:hypothetical protein
MTVGRQKYQPQYLLVYFVLGSKTGLEKVEVWVPAEVWVLAFQLVLSPGVGLSWVVRLVAGRKPLRPGGTKSGR